jgi:threonine/homoserine/homoserine lactone efflux protein
MTFVVSATPGPNMLLVMSHGARFGLRSAVMTMAGCMTALLCMMSISAAGLGALLHTFPTVFDVLRYVGAAYLAYLGVKLWRSGVPTPSGETADGHDEPGRSDGSYYRQGLAVAASNPKAIVFAAAFFPQFIQPELPAMAQFVILLATFTVITVFAASPCAEKLQPRHRWRVCGFCRLDGGQPLTFQGGAQHARVYPRQLCAKLWISA